MRRTGTTRRGALTATGAIAMGAVLAGCGSGGDDESAGRKGSARADARTAADRSSAETSLRVKARGVSTSLYAQYEHVVQAHPATAAGLTPFGTPFAPTSRPWAPATRSASSGPGPAPVAPRRRSGNWPPRNAVPRPRTPRR